MSGLIKYSSIATFEKNPRDYANNVNTDLNSLFQRVNSLSDSLDGNPNVNLTSNGPETSTFNAGMSITAMDLVYLKSDGTWWQTDADAVSTGAGMLGISLATKTSGNAMRTAIDGTFIRNDSWSWTVGDVLYMSTTAGAITSTQPSGTDDVIRVIGFAVKTNVIYFNPSPDYITHV